MRRHFYTSHLFHEILSVVPFVGSQGDALPATS
jgi:hypothetical protein